MSFRPFTSESYSEDARLEAWRDVLSAVGLRPSAGSAVQTGHATASRRNADGVVLARLAAGLQRIVDGFRLPPTQGTGKRNGPVRFRQLKAA